MNKTISINIRKLILDAIVTSKRGHISSAFSIVEILYVLYFKNLNISPSNINKITRDRFILSKGHGCLALYAILYLKKFITLKQLNSFCEKDSILGGHPESHLIPGVEFIFAANFFAIAKVIFFSFIPLEDIAPGSNPP